MKLAIALLVLSAFANVNSFSIPLYRVKSAFESRRADGVTLADVARGLEQKYSRSYAPQQYGGDEPMKDYLMVCGLTVVTGHTHTLP
jgi:hypothetical protein